MIDNEIKRTVWTAALIRLAMREVLDRRREGKTPAVKLGPRKED